MSTVIYKYPLKLGATTLTMPLVADILCVQIQNHLICLWAEVADPDGPSKSREFVVLGTGHDIPERAGTSRMYIGTVQHNEFVWHVFEVV